MIQMTTDDGTKRYTSHLLDAKETIGCVRDAPRYQDRPRRRTKRTKRTKRCAIGEGFKQVRNLIRRLLDGAIDRQAQSNRLGLLHESVDEDWAGVDESFRKPPSSVIRECQVGFEPLTFCKTGVSTPDYQCQTAVLW
jgi:hypothetical protein